MSHRQMTRLVREGDYVAEVSVDLIEAEGGWSPYLTLHDAYRLDDIRDALRRGDMRTASRMAAPIPPLPKTPYLINPIDHDA